MSIEIVDEGVHGLDRYSLLVDGNRKASVTRKSGGAVELHFEVYGPTYWKDAHQLLEGLLELSVYADQLAGEKHDRKKA